MALPRSETYVLCSTDFMPSNIDNLWRLKAMISDTHSNTTTLLIKDDVVLDRTTLNSIINLLKNNRKITLVQLEKGNKADLFKLAAAFTASFFPQERDVKELNNLFPAQRSDDYFAKVVANVRAYLKRAIFNHTLTEISVYQEGDNKAGAPRVVLPLARLQHILNANALTTEEQFLACDEYINQANYLCYAQRYHFFPVITVNPIDGVVLDDNLRTTHFPRRANTQAKRRQFYLAELSKPSVRLSDNIAEDHQIGINDFMSAGHELLTAQNLIKAGCSTIANVDLILAHLAKARERLEKTPRDEMDNNELVWLMQCSLSSLHILSSVCKQTRAKRHKIAISTVGLPLLLARAEAFMQACEAWLATHQPKDAEIYLTTLARYAIDMANTYQMLEDRKILENPDETEKWLRICFSLYSRTTLNDSHIKPYLHNLYQRDQRYPASKCRELFKPTLALVIEKKPNQQFALINNLLTYMANQSILHQLLYDLVTGYITQNEVNAAMRDSSTLVRLFCQFITDIRHLLNQAIASQDLETKKMIHDLMKFFFAEYKKLPNSIFSLYLAARPGSLQLLINHLDQLMKPAGFSSLQDKVATNITAWFVGAAGTLGEQEKKLDELFTQLKKADSELARLQEENSKTKAVATRARKRKRGFEEDENSSPKRTKTVMSLKTRGTLFPPADDDKMQVEPLSPVKIPGKRNTR